MPIQRQSESFGIFDDGPRFARDRSPADLPKGLAALVNTSGPRIQGGMLNTRTAGWHHPEYDPRVDGYPDEGHDNWDRDSFDPGWEGFDEDDPELESLEANDPDRFVPEDRVDPRTAAALRRRAQADPDDDEGGPWAARDLPDGRFPEDEWGHPDHGKTGRSGSRHPFDRTAACQACGGDVLPDGGDWSHVDAYLDGDHDAEPGDDDLDNDEYGQGRDPAAAHDEYEHRMLNQARLAGWAEDNPSWDETMKNIDDTLAAGEGPDPSDTRRDWPEDWDARTAPIEDLHEAYSESDQYGNEGYFKEHAWEELKRRHEDGEGDDDLAEWYLNHSGIDNDTGLYTSYDDPEGHEQELQALRDRVDNHRRRLRGSYTAAQQQMVVPAAGGYQPAHRVGLPWRDTVIPGTVIALDGPNVGVRWDDGQYSSEEPHNIQLL